MSRLDRLEAMWKWLAGESFDACEISTADIQDKGIELGLLRVVPYDPAKHGNDVGAEYDMKPGDDYLEVVKP